MTTRTTPLESNVRNAADRSETELELLPQTQHWRTAQTMIPVSLLLAFILAFGTFPTESTGPLPDIGLRVIETIGGVALVALLSLGLGYWVSSGVDHLGHASARLRSRYTLGSRLLAVIALAIYAWIIHWVGWAQIIKSNWGLDGWLLIDDLLILLPYLAIQLAMWCGIYTADTALNVRPLTAGEPSLPRFLWLRGRQSFGLILPVLLAYLIRGDLLERFWPGWDHNPWAESLEVAIVGTSVILAAPFFVRIAWPMHRLPDGPTRQRLECAAQRAGFRFTDILVWNTGHTMVNACVSGVLPQFRYIMLTDLLLETLSPPETAAVFGHEIGHVAHRHQLFFGLFFLGSVSLLALTSDLLAALANIATRGTWIANSFSQSAVEITEVCLLILLVAIYIWRVFGSLSRTFERQADVYGTRIISCERPDCPPHAEPTRGEAPAGDIAIRPPSGIARNQPASLCPIGIHTFTTALASVSTLNGVPPERYSWRHGSIARRIAFIQSLNQIPTADRDFQHSVVRQKLILGFVFISAFTAEILWQRTGF